jgi:hypothetical protein
MRWRVAHTRLRFHCCPRHPTGLDGVHALRGPAGAGARAVDPAGSRGV